MEGVVHTLQLEGGCVAIMLDGADLGEALLEQGFAQVYRFNNELFDRLSVYLNAEDTARQSRRGLWQ